MARWTARPDPRLARWVESIAFSIDDPGSAPSTVRVLPDGRTDLLFSLEVSSASTQRTDGRLCTSAVFGTKTAPLFVSDKARVENIAVSFRPGAAERFFDLPAHELTDRALDIERQSPDGSWKPRWSWFGNYPEVWPIAEGEWAGQQTLLTLRSLRAWGRLPD